MSFGHLVGLGSLLIGSAMCAILIDAHQGLQECSKAEYASTKADLHGYSPERRKALKSEMEVACKIAEVKIVVAQRLIH